MNWDLTLGLVGLLFAVLVPVLMWRIWRAGDVIEDRLNSAYQNTADARRSVHELQRILDATRNSKGPRG